MRLTSMVFDELVQSHLDGTITPTGRRALEASLAIDDSRRDLFERYEAIGAAIRQGVPTPDQTGSILLQLERQGLFRSARQRRRTMIIRSAWATAAMAAAVALAAWPRVFPGPGPGPAGPLSAVVEAGRQDAARAVAAVERARESWNALAPAPARTSELGLTMGDTASVANAVRWEVTVAGAAGSDLRPLHAPGAETRALDMRRASGDAPLRSSRAWMGVVWTSGAHAPRIPFALRVPGRPAAADRAGAQEP